MRIGWNIIAAASAITAAIADDLYCRCMGPYQEVEFGSTTYLQHPTLGGRPFGNTCTKNCTFTATRVDSCLHCEIFVNLTSNMLGDGFIWIDGMDDIVLIDSNTPLGILEAKSLDNSIRISFIECPSNEGQFAIELFLQAVWHPVIDRKYMVFIIGGGCAVVVILVVTIFWFRRKIFTRHKIRQDDENPLIDDAPEIGEESNEFSSIFSNQFVPKKICGVGGFGCVLEAVNNYDKWTYAVKRVVVDAMDVEKALREVRAMAQIDHPNIVRYHHTWVEKPPDGWQKEKDVELLANLESPENKAEMELQLEKFNSNSVFIYIQMQLYNWSLKSWLADNTDPSSRDPPRMRSWFKQIVLAVAYIHKKNLIHRDLKPSNILFAEADLLKLCDLGIATERRFGAETNSDISRTRIGTTLYESPEQKSLMCRCSSKTDVFTLGLILAELSKVMTGAERFKIFNNYREGIQCQSIADNRTAKFIEKLTQVEPKHRPSCNEMLDNSFLA